MNPLEEVNKNLRSVSPWHIKRVALFFRYRYPKIALLIISVVFAYYIFSNPVVGEWVVHLENLSYAGMFIAGMMFAFGFSAPFAVGFLITINPANIFLAAGIAGLGAFVSDMIIFKVIKVSFSAEFGRLKKSKMARSTRYHIDTKLGPKIGNYLLYFFAGILIASPLPDEAGVTMLAGLTRIKAEVLGLISFILNTIGIFLILYLL